MEITHIHFNSIDSTNTWAKRSVLNFDKNKITCVSADSQTHGRGRFNRQWVSPPNCNIYASFCLFIDKSRTDIANLGQVMGISVANVLKKMGFAPDLKWPNDLLINEKKVCGILCETVSNQNTLCLIIGVGLNVNLKSDAITEIEKLGRKATSLYVERSKEFSVKEILREICKEFGTNVDLFLKGGFTHFLNTYRNLSSSFRNKKISFHNGDTIVEGQFHDIDADGTLLLSLSGQVKKFAAGEILESS